MKHNKTIINGNNKREEFEKEKEMIVRETNRKFSGNCSNNNIFKTEINTKKNKQNKKKSKDFISKYEELLGVDQSYKTKKPKIYITSYDALNDKKNYQIRICCNKV